MNVKENMNNKKKDGGRRAQAEEGTVKGEVEEQMRFARYLKKWLVAMVAGWVDASVLPIMFSGLLCMNVVCLSVAKIIIFCQKSAKCVYFFLIWLVSDKELYDSYSRNVWMDGEVWLLFCYLCRVGRERGSFDEKTRGRKK